LLKDRLKKTARETPEPPMTSKTMRFPHCLLAMASKVVWEASSYSPLRVGGEQIPSSGGLARLASSLLAVASYDSPGLSKMVFFTQKPQIQAPQSL
jgi:hypothetical protein